MIKSLVLFVLGMIVGAVALIIACVLYNDKK